MASITDLKRLFDRFHDYVTNQSRVDFRDYLVCAIREVMNGNKDFSTYTRQAYLAQ